LLPISTAKAANNWNNIRLLTVNLKKKFYPNVNSTTQRYPNKIIKTFLIEDFLHLPPVLTTLVVHLELRLSPKFSKKFETALMRYSGVWVKLIHEKNTKSKISWHCPFKICLMFINQHYPIWHVNSVPEFNSFLFC
jgi:hypothetical protein